MLSKGGHATRSDSRTGRQLTVLLLVVFWAAGLVGTALADEELDYGLETHRLAKIEIRGNRTFDAGTLKNLLRIQEASWKRPLHVPRYQPYLVDAQLRLLQTFYRSQGFHQVAVQLDSITTIPEKGDVLHIGITEGPRTMIREVSFTGTGPLSETRLRSILRLLEGEPAPADLNAYGGDIYALRDLYRNETYLDATVVPTVTVSPDSLRGDFAARVVYHIRPGHPYHVGRISLSGNEHTRDRLLNRELVIHAGDPLRWRLVEDSRRRLLATSLFRDVNIVPTGVDTARGLADLMVRVVERKPAFYELGVGIGSRERIRLLGSWGHYNLWGTGQRLQVRGRGSWNVEDVLGRSLNFDQGQINYRTDLEYVNPRLRDSRYSLDFDIYGKRETRGESGLNLFGYGANLGTTWKASHRVTNNVYLGYKVTDPEIHPYAPQDLKDRFAAANPGIDRVRSLNWAVYIDHRDDIFRPTTGSYSVGTTQLAGAVLGGDFTFFKWTVAWHKYHHTFLGGTLAARVKLGGTRPFGKSADQGPDGVPYDDRFFAGGESSVRGYANNSLGPQISDPEERDNLDFSSDVFLPDNPARGGNYMMLTNLEWRFPLPLLRRLKLSGVFFLDGGNVWERLRNVRIEGFRLRSHPGDPDDPGSTKVWDYRYSYGTGIRLDTPFGPVRVDVGFPLKRVRYVSDTRDYRDPETVWHFSLGYPF